MEQPNPNPHCKRKDHQLSNGNYISSQAIENIHRYYGKLLQEEKFETLRDFEKRHTLPITWSNYAISSLIRQNPDLSDKLITEFRDRGFEPDNNLK